MKKKAFKINIPEPCHEKWNEMSPETQGRHCQKCSKTVVDFTTKADWEIAEIYKKTEGKLCGRFNATQLEREIAIESPFVRFTRWKAASLLLGGFLAASSASAQHKTMGKPAIQTYAIPVLGEIEAVPSSIQILQGKVMTNDKPANGASITCGAKKTYADINGDFQIEIDQNQKIKLTVSYIDFRDKTMEISTAHFKKNNLIINLEVNAIPVEAIKTVYTTGVTHFTPSKKQKKALRKEQRLEEKRLEEIRLKEKIAIKEAALMNEIIGKMVAEPVTPEKKKRSFFKQEEKESGTLKESQKETLPKKEQQSPTLSNPDWIQKIYPNPFGNEVNVTIKSEQKEKLRLVLTDVKGSEIKVEIIKVTPGFNFIQLDFSQNRLVPGSYFLSLLRGEEILQTTLLVND